MGAKDIWEGIVEWVQDSIESARDFPPKAKDYFSALSQMEYYGWGVFALGFVLFIVGVIVWL